MGQQLDIRTFTPAKAWQEREEDELILHTEQQKQGNREKEVRVSLKQWEDSKDVRTL
jgi:hypothetical protein